jgi:hypothetical protein
MSQAFVKDEEGQWLNEIGPSLTALIVFLTRENNDIPVRLRDRTPLIDGREGYVMSNGLRYAKNREGKWEVV